MKPPESILTRLRDALQEAFADGDENGKVSRGNVSPELLQRFRHYGHFKEDLRTRIDRATEDAGKELERRFESEQDEVERMHNELWDAVHTEMKLPPEGKYSVDCKTGEVKEKIRGKKDDADGILN